MGLLSQILMPRAATPENPRFNINSPEAWDMLAAGNASSSGVRVTRSTALTYPAFWRGVNLIANAVGKVPLFVYERVGDGKQRATTHPAYQLLRYSPLPGRAESTAFDYKRTKMGHVLCRGNGYSYIFRDGDATPRELLLLDPDATYPVRYNGRLWYVTTIEGEERKLVAENVLHWKGLGWDGLCGYDVLTFAAEALGEGIAKQKYSAKFFGNNARPGVVIEVPTKLKDGGAQALLAGWSKMHQGLDNAHKTAVLDNGAKVNPFTIDADKAQLIESRKISLVDTANVLNLPPHKLGHDGTTAFASLEQENQSWLDDCIDPWFCMIEAETREKLLTEREKVDDSHVIEFLRQALIRADMVARANYYRTALGGRPWMLPDEVRGAENLNPLGGEAAEYLNPLNMGKGGADNQPTDPNGNQPGSPTNNNAKLWAAIARGIEKASLQVIKRIGVHAKRAAKDSVKYLAFVAEFPAEHRAVTGGYLLSSVDMIAALHGSGLKPETAADDLLSQIACQLSAVADTASKAQLVAKVDECLALMELEIPPAFARQLTRDDPS